MTGQGARHSSETGLARMENDPAGFARRLLTSGSRVLIWGPTGAGKSTLAARLAAQLATKGRSCWGIAADPGSPGFGVPGALAVGSWQDGEWRVASLSALCTLDAARYRLPLVQALRRLAGRAPNTPLLVDAPGVVRGTVAAELLAGMIDAADVDLVLALLPEGGAEAEAAKALLRNLEVEVLVIAPSPLARRRSKKQRARDRTAEWDSWLASAQEQTLALSTLRLTGLRPRSLEDWSDRQVALLGRRAGTAALGEVIGQEGDRIRVRLRWIEDVGIESPACLVRDAERRPDGLLGTVGAGRRTMSAAALPPDLASPNGEGADPACFVHLGTASALLLNGVFGDPLLHIRLRQSGRSLLFDLGDNARLPARIAHQVSDVFISHAHMDHIGGFLWFLRSRIGETSLCRLYGPPGLADHICAFIDAIRWDRIGDRGPRFEIHELHGDRVLRFLVQTGAGRERQGEVSVKQGTLLEEAGFRVRSVILDHGIPVLAFAFEVAPSIRISKSGLKESGLADGAWLGVLKRQLLAGDALKRIRLPDGRMAVAAEVAEDLVERQPQRRLVYGTDLADTAENRRRLVALARGADVLICEAGFTQADAMQAKRTGHLTARACGEIAAAAGVGRLVPFHFSHRYEKEPDLIYEEVEAAFGAPLAGPRAV
ncbi:MAG: MBL fold metallo-hydrolase [Pseudomonadota bacterium]|nr:MBL fold metallo-hydrolase [Pseudomonadota bacterium]